MKDYGTCDWLACVTDVQIRQNMFQCYTSGTDAKSPRAGTEDGTEPVTINTKLFVFSFSGGLKHFGLLVLKSNPLNCLIYICILAF